MRVLAEYMVLQKQTFKYESNKNFLNKTHIYFSHVFMLFTWE